MRGHFFWSICYVRFTPKSGHVRCNSPCPLWANSGHQSYSITSSATKSRPGGIVTLSAFLESDDGFELGRRLYRKISWLVAAQDTVDVGRQRLCMGTGLGVTIVAANMRSTTASWRRWDGAESTRKR